MDYVLFSPAYPFIAAAVLNALLMGYVLMVGAGRILRFHIMAVGLAGLVWSTYYAVVPTASGGLSAPDFLVELMLLLAWYGLLERLLRGPYLQSMPELVRRGIRWVWLAVLVVGIAAALPMTGISGIAALPDFYYFGILLLTLLALALAAQFLGDATIENSRALRSICLAAVVVTGMQGLLFAIALLTAVIPAWMLLVRAVGLCLSMGLISYALHTNPQWSLAIFVSPQARIYAPRLVAVGAFLLMLLAVAPIFRTLPQSDTPSAAVVLVLLVGAALLVVLFSDRLRARLRVFFSKHFLPFRYDYREEWLRLIDTLASPEQKLPLPERAIKSLAQIVGSPAGMLWMRGADEGTYTCMAAWNTKVWSQIVVTAQDPVIQFMRDRQWILDTAELMRKPEFYGGLQRPDWLELFPDALLVVPLISNQHVIGFIVLFQSSSAFRLTFEEIDLFRTSGRQVAVHLAQYMADQQLAEAKQFEAFNRLTAFVMHDLKNLIAQQSLMVRNAAKHKNNPDFFKDAVATIENSVARMNKLMQQLQTGDTTGPSRTVSLVVAVKEAIKKCQGREPKPAFIELGQSVEARIDSERLVSVLEHLIRNAQEATDPDGSVTVRTELTDGQARITVADDGCGMDSDFIRSRLFRPFDSTKGSKGMGIGAYQARSFILACGGAMEVTSTPGVGTNVVIELPAAGNQEVIT